MENATGRPDLSQRVQIFSTYECEPCKGFWEMYHLNPEYLTLETIREHYEHLHIIHRIPPNYLEDLK